MGVHKFTPQTENFKQVTVEGSFAPNGSSAVDAAKNKGTGFSVSRTGVGTFEITFDNRYHKLVRAEAHLQLAAAADQIAQVGSYTAPTDSAKGKLVIRVWDISGAAVADVAADDNNRINFVAVFKDSHA